MIEYIMISNIDGVPLFHRNYTSRELFTELLSGVFSAVDFFSINHMKKRLEQIQMEDRYITFRKETVSDSEILFILISQHCLGCTNQNDCICVPSTLQEIHSEFIRRYGKRKLKGVVNTGIFSGFDVYVDEIVERHFKAHCYIDNFITDFGKNKKANQELLGFVSFKNGNLLNYHLRSELGDLRYQKLMSSIEPWEQLLKTEKPRFKRQLSYLDGFKSIVSLIKMGDDDRIHLFTFWKTEISDDLMNDLHDSVQQVLGYSDSEKKSITNENKNSNIQV
ncbi:MAG: hypothetical protein ACTSRU_12675 [Candidatus Hodarchaeales archaeon]